MEDYLESLKNNIDKHDILLILQGFQQRFGYLSQDFIVKLSERTGISAGSIYSIATFYSQFRFFPVSKYHIKICSGSSCHTNAMDSIKHEILKLTGLDKNAKSNDSKFSIEYVNCLGACAKGPVIEINGKFYAGLKSRDIKEIIANLD
jgi:NADH-quinone oxidoreductase subunit E